MTNTPQNGNALTHADSPWYLKILDRFGVPTAMLAAVLYFVFMTAQWTANTVIVPLTNGHLKTLDIVQQQLTQQTRILETTGTCAARIENLVRETTQTILTDHIYQRETLEYIRNTLKDRKP